VLFDDDKQLMLMIAAKELEDNNNNNNNNNNNKKRQGSKVGRFASLGTTRSGIGCSCQITSPRYAYLLCR
jgi:hypothetical protein